MDNCDLKKLIQCRSILSEGLPNEELYGFTAQVGVPLGFEQT